MFFFAAIPQSREVYLGIIEDRGIVHGVLGLVLLGFACFLLHCWQHMLGTAAIDRMYPEHADVYIDRNLLDFRNWLCRISAFLPLIGLAFGLIRLAFDAHEAGLKFNSALAAFGGKEAFPEFGDTFDVLPRIWVSVVLMAVLVVVPTVFIVRYGQRRRERLVPSRYSLREGAVLAGAAISLTAIVAPLVARDFVVPATQAVGPLAGAALVLIVLITILMGLSYLLSRSRWPLVSAAVFVLLMWMVWLTYDALTPRRLETVPGAAAGRSVHSREKLHEAFSTWLSARGKERVAFRHYPVFIISAQGGGIYAAAASSAFLAAMQDKCPSFAQHVFAISGVSGGAVGSALFAAAMADKPIAESAGCLGRLEAAPISGETRKVVQRDHLSPALSLIWPDVARKMLFADEPDFDRSSVLERSFACAFEQRDALTRCPPARGGATGLRAPFEHHWRLDRSAPALILATTWVETGLRAAFAPFPLHAISDGTLNSFHQSKEPEGDFPAQGVELEASRSLIEAAFVSARFPGIAPAWQQYAELRGRSQVRLWNFVDGGYVDNSGATTAHELYLALDAYIRQKELPVDLYLVMLTDARTDPDFANVDSGSGFSDIVAPITALLNVRSQLAYRAVTRAINRLAPDARPEELAGIAGNSRVLAVDLYQETFELPLGWKMSRITDTIVRLMLGRPDLCETPIPADSGRKSIVRIIRDNSCVKRRLESLLTPGAG